MDTGLSFEAAAVHFVGGSGTFEAALETSLSFAGPANYSPVLVGSLGGARWGTDGIPEEMLGHCTVLSRVRSGPGLASRWAERA